MNLTRCRYYCLSLHTVTLVHGEFNSSPGACAMVQEVEDPPPPQYSISRITVHSIRRVHDKLKFSCPCAASFQVSLSSTNATGELAE